MDRASSRRWRRLAGASLAAATVIYSALALPAWAADEADTVAPVVSYAGIAAGTLVGPEALLLPRASDNVAITKMDLLVNGVRHTTRLGSPFVIRWHTAGIPAGDTTVQIIAYDAAGNASIPATANVRVDNEGPVVAFPEPLADSYSGTGKMPFQVHDTDITKIELMTLQGRTLLGTVTSAPWVLDMNTTGAYNGPIQVLAKAYDAIGNVTEVRAQIRLDNVAPILTVHYGWPAMDGYVRSGGLLTIGVRDESRSTVDLLVDGTVVSSDSVDDGTATLRWPNTPNGPAGMTVRGTDVHGHVTELNRRVVVDNDAPVIRLNVAEGADVRQNFAVKITSIRDATGVTSAYYSSKTLAYGASPSAPSWTTTFGGSRGWHTFTAGAIDMANNRVTINRRVYLDDLRPKVAFSKPPKNNSTLRKTVKLKATAGDNRAVARVQLLVNGKVVATDTKAGYTFTLNPKKYGKKFTVQLRAYDRAGNVKYSPKRTYRR